MINTQSELEEFLENLDFPEITSVYIEKYYDSKEVLADPSQKSDLYKKIALSKEFSLKELGFDVPSYHLESRLLPRLITRQDNILHNISNIGYGDPNFLPEIRITKKEKRIDVASIGKTKGFGFDSAGYFMIKPLAVKEKNLYHASSVYNNLRNVSPFFSLLRSGYIGNLSLDFPTYLSSERDFSLLHSLDFPKEDNTHYGLLFRINKPELIKYRHIYPDPESINYKGEIGVSYFVRGGIPINCINGIMFSKLLESRFIDEKWP